MVRQRTRKSIEELYGNNKFESSKSHQGNIAGNSNSLKPLRVGDRDYGYIITASTPYNTGPSNNVSTSGAVTARRKNARASGTTGKADKYCNKEEKLAEDLKKEQQSIKLLKPTRNGGEKCPYNSAANIYDNKMYAGTLCTDRSKDGGHSSNETMAAHQHQHQHHHHNHNHRSARSHDDDKDDDTEEFFELIRHTVESAIGKSISDLLNRNFRELAAKVDRFSSELRNTNALLNKLQTDLSNKVVHYGEENSRHFRYLCMKSEYDKMFYQHQSMIAAGSSTNPITSEKQSPTSYKNHPSSLPSNINASARPIVENDKVPCSCRGSNSRILTNNDAKEPHKSPSDEQNLSRKSSELGMKEVLEHIQRFCNQMQLTEMRCDLRGGSGGNHYTGKYSNPHKRTNLKLNKQMFDDDEDLDITSDGMTPRSNENIQVHKYGSKTERPSSTTKDNVIGGGDA